MDFMRARVRSMLPPYYVNRSMQSTVQNTEGDGVWL